MFNCRFHYTPDIHRLPVRDNSGDHILARWLADTERARNDTSGFMAWRVYDSLEYAELWYDARDAGERVRAKTLRELYAKQRRPGGPYPDPREPGAFSALAVATHAARSMDLHVWQRPVSLTQPGKQPAPHAQQASQQTTQQTRHIVESDPLAWLATYPTSSGRQNTLGIHEETEQIPLARIIFDMACMIGYIHRERTLLDPYAPRGVSLLPRNQGMRSLLHQFAIALLCLEPECPVEWACHCNVTRARYNSPPPDHEQPTDTLNLADLRAHIPHVTPPLHPND